MKIIGSNVSNLSRQNVISGIQRIIIETHKSLFQMNDHHGFKCAGVQASQTVMGENFKKNEYFLTDPILNGKLLSIESVSTLLLLDYDFTIDFSKLYLLKKTNNLKIVAVIYDLIPILNPNLFENGLEFSRLFRVYIQKIAYLSDVIIFNSQKSLNDFLSLGWSYSAQLKVVPLGAFNQILEAPPTAQPSKTIISVGTIEPRKQQSIIIEAFDILRSKHLDFRLFLVGNYGWLFDERQILKHPEYGARLRWFQNLNDFEVKRLYGSSSIAVCASLDEGFGLPIEEALSSHVKVLANRIETFVERTQPNLFFFDGTAIDLANKILELEDVEYKSSALAHIRKMESFSVEIAQILVNI
jgi:glycosyltransferase involved in cell wall biosynthesis